MWSEVLERFEQHAPVGVMARVALEQALPTGWIDQVFEASRQRQYPRDLMMSTVVELMMLVSLGLRPSLHAAARKMEQLPVSLAALYDKVNRTEPAVLRALVQGSATRLAPVMAQLDGQASLPSWRLRILDGNHLPASQKRLAPLRDYRGAALPGHTLVDLRSRPSPGHGHCGVRGCERERASRGPNPGGVGAGGPAVAGCGWLTATFAPARCYRAGSRRGQPSSCASMAAIPGWCSKAAGTKRAAAKPVCSRSSPSVSTLGRVINQIAPET